MRVCVRVCVCVHASVRTDSAALTCICLADAFTFTVRSATAALTCTHKPGNDTRTQQTRTMRVPNLPGGVWKKLIGSIASAGS